MPRKAGAWSLDLQFRSDFNPAQRTFCPFKSLFIAISILYTYIHPSLAAVRRVHFQQKNVLLSLSIVMRFILLTFLLLGLLASVLGTALDDYVWEAGLFFPF